MKLHRLASSGPAVDAHALLGAVWGQEIDLVVVPAARLPDGFFTLSTGVAGDLLQKLVNHGLRIAVVGDLSAHLERSTSLRDFVRESNRGRQAWFFANETALQERMERDG